MSENKPQPILEQAHAFTSSIRKLQSPPMTASEIVDRGLLFAKPAPSHGEMASAYRFYKFLILGGSERLRPIESFFAEQSELLDRWWTASEKDRKAFSSCLREFLEDPHKARSRRASYVKAIQDGVFMYTDINDEGTEFISRFHPLSDEAGYKLVLFLLCTQDRWKRLKKCEYSPCSSYFLRKASRQGGRPRKYCSEKCYKLADQQKALVRQKKQAQ